MLDLKQVRKDPDIFKASLKKRNANPEEIDQLLELDARHRALQVEVDSLRAERNRVSKSIGKLVKEGKDITEVKASVAQLGEKLKATETEIKDVESERKLVLMRIPNVLHEDVPAGVDDSENLEVKVWGEKPNFDFEPKAHEEVGLDRNWMDFERSAKLAGARFVVMKGWGARLERALASFMLDMHVEKHGYTEVSPPFISNRETMTANGNLPKFEEDLFALTESDFFLIPTSEVPLTNLHRTEIMAKEDLPKYYTAHTPCFRSEAGSAGKDTRGIIRLHQFAKVEMVKVVEPETSMDELDKMVENAEAVLQALELPYRIVVLCGGDTGFNATKTFDLEAWFPAQGKYREISSCSNCTDFQARRGMTRYRPEPEAPTAFPHTLNGSGLPIGRTLAAILENHQQADGTVRVPKALQPYLGGETVLS